MSNYIFKQTFRNIEIDRINPIVKSSYQNVVKQIINKEIEPIDIINKNDDVNIFKDVASDIIRNFKHILLLGVGGSSLGAKTFCSISESNNLTFLESIDPQTINYTIQKLDINNTLFLVVSKSGETIETICQTLIIIDYLKNLKIEEIAKKFLFVTEDKDNSIKRIANKIGARSLNHPSEVGGRFSCFSITGLLPAAIAGLDIFKIIEGAKLSLGNFLQEKGNSVVEAIHVQTNLFDNGYKSNVIMPYIDSLKNFTDWYRQLWAESLGKDGFGSTPINSMGTVDQHSQLQLYLDGPRDKFFTFITLANQKKDYKINDLQGCKTLFGNKEISKILEIEHQTTIETLAIKNLPIRIINFSNIDELAIGSIMMHMFLETILLATLKGINPFDQPAVENRKNLARKMLLK